MTQPPTRTLTRRSATRGAVWTFPAVGVAAAAPAYAASPCDTPATGSVTFGAASNYIRRSAAFGAADVAMSDGSTLRVEFNSTMTIDYVRVDADNLRAGPTAPFPNALSLLQGRG